MKATSKKPSNRARKRTSETKPASRDTNGKSQAFREIEMEWMNSHPEEFRKCAGEYVVVHGPRIVAHSKDAAEAIREARRKGVKVPFIFFVPPPLPKNTYWIGP